MRTNINKTKRLLESRSETSQVQIDGDTSGAIFRAIVEYDAVDRFESTVDESEAITADVTRKKNVGFGVEVTLQ